MSDSLSKDIESLRAYWDQKAEKETSHCARIESGPRGQQMRFENFRRMHDLRGASVLDVGCGVGDFYAHVIKSGGCRKYLGVDLSESMIAISRERFPAADFRMENVLESAPGRFDYTVAFAVHNVKVPAAREMLERLTRRQFELCGIAAHVDILTDRYNGFDTHIQSWRAEEVLTMALGITPYVKLNHDFLPNDFSVTLYREPLVDRCSHLFDE